MKGKQVLVLGTFLIIAGAVVLVLSVLRGGGTTLSCEEVSWVNESCFQVRKPGILCVGGNASIQGLREVNSPTDCGGEVAYVIEKQGKYCIQQSFGAAPSVKLCVIREMSGIESVMWVSGSLAVIGGLILLYKYVTRGSDEVKEEYVVGGGRIICKAKSLTRHECRIDGVGDRSSEAIRVISEYLRSTLNYRVRDLQERYAILERGNALGLGKGKPVTLLIHVKDNDIILEYSVAPLQASGLYDLREFAEELNSIFENSALRDLLSQPSR